MNDLRGQLEELRAENSRLKSELESLRSASPCSAPPRSIAHLEQSLGAARLFLDAASVLVVVLDPEARIVLLNQTAANVLQCSASEVIGREWFETFIPENMRTRLRRMFDQLVSGQLPLEGTLQSEIETTQGGTRLIEWQNTLLREEEASAPFAVLCSGRDCTDQARIEADLQRLATALEQSAESVIITDMKGIIVYVNPAFTQHSGYTREEAVGQNPRIVKSGQHPPSLYRQIWQTVLDGETWQGVLTNRTKSGNLYTEDCTFSPIRDESGVITNVVAVKRNITNEIELERRIAQSEKLEAVGSLASGISHDFNNILSAILGFSEIAYQDAHGQANVQESLAEIIKAGQRAQALIQQILTFSRQDRQQQKKPLDLSTTVEEVITLVRGSISPSIRIDLDIEPSLDLILADPTQMHQVLMNLLVNAGQAVDSFEKQSPMPVPDPHIRVRLHNRSILSQDVEQSLKLKEGDYVQIEVTDNGIGMTPSTLSRIFDPYFSTKSKSKGTGLGLSTVRGIVESQDGEIQVSSKPNKGTTFTLLIPAHQLGADPSISLPSALVSSSGQGEKILFVDDEEAICRFMKHSLERIGYSVDTLSHPEQALDILREAPDRYEILITDYSMPHMDGMRLVRNLRAEGWKHPVILCTGYHERLDAEQTDALNISELILKPVQGRELSSVILRVLDMDNA